MRGIRSLIAVCIMLWMSVGMAHAQNVQLTLTPTLQTGPQGMRLQFQATVKNNGTQRVYLNQPSVSFPSTDKLTADPTDFFTNFAGALDPGKSKSGKVAFAVQVELNATAGTYGGTFAILGGSNEDAANNLTQQDFQVKVFLDNTPPDTNMTEGPAEGVKVCSPSLQICGQGVNSASHAEQYEYSTKLDSGAWSAWQSNSCKTLNGLTEGLHTISLRSRDQSGNVDASPVVRNFYVDLTAPAISNISLAIRDVKTTINWTTNEPATTQIEYGATTAYGQTSPLDSNMTGSHQVLLTGLMPKTLYHYRLRSSDGCKETLSSDRTFTTREILKPNLKVVDCDVPANARDLYSVDIRWAVQNIGLKDIPGSDSWKDALWLSETTTLTGSAVLLGKFPINGPLAEANRYGQRQTVKIPLKPSGQYYILIQTDADKNLDEAGESDNIKAVPITIVQANTLVAAPDRLELSVKPGFPLNGTFEIGNLSGGTLTELKAEVQNGLSNVAIQITLPAQIANNEVKEATYKITASDESILTGLPKIRLTAKENAEAFVEIPLTVIPRRPQVVVTPGSFAAGMTRGNQSFIEVEIANTGLVAATNLRVSLPSAPWLSLVTPENMGDIPPDGKAKITLALNPAKDLTLGAYTGTIAVNGGNVSLGINYRFDCVSDQKGKLRVIAEDEYTYFQATRPQVQNAFVRVTDSQTGAIVVEGKTDEEGLFEVEDMPEAIYNLEVTADQHSPFRSTLEVKAGQDGTTTRAFMPRQFVSYVWSVIPVEVQDKYLVTLEAVFETHVPAPVVTISPAYLDINQLVFDERGETVVNYTITNHGLVAANGLNFTFGSHPEYQITPAITDLGNLAALSTVVVPVTFRKTFAHSGPCYTGGTVYYYEICGEKRTKCESTTVHVHDDCPAFVPPGGGPGGGGGIFPVGTSPPSGQGLDFCDPCLLKRIKAILECVWSLISFKDCELTAAKSAGSCYSSWSSNGFGVQTFVDCTFGGLNTAYKCGLVVAGKTTFGWIYKTYKVLKCIKKIVTACDDSGGIRIQADSPAVLYLKGQMDRLEPLANAYAEIFGDPKWLDTEIEDPNISWFEEFRLAIAPDGDAGGVISATERATLLSAPLPQQVTIEDAVKVVERWNRTLNYYAAGIYKTSDVPNGQSTDFIDAERLVTKWETANAQLDKNLLDGHVEIFDGITTAVKSIYGEAFTKEEGICAKVKVKLDQQVTLTRTAFRATLELSNAAQNPNALENIQVQLEIRDSDQQVATQLFAISPPALTNLNDVDGAGVLDPSRVGTAQWTILPTRDAAPLEAKTYYVGGKLTYTEAGQATVIPLFPTPITVKPDPLLTLHYFWQRDVYSDDPFTAPIEPAEPFAVALLVLNKGKGTARNMKIVSSQPEIVENEKGLLIGFKIIGSRVNSEEVSPSLQVNLGDIEPDKTTTACWKMIASLQGKFISYDAKFKHLDGLGNERTSLIDKVDIHELEHLVRVDNPSDDGKPDFLVALLKDTIYKLYNSDGNDEDGGSPVTPHLTDATTDGPISGNRLQGKLTVPNVGSGWFFARLDDPSQARYRLIKVIRSDGKEIRVDDNAWTTKRTIRLQGQAPFVQTRLYLFDKGGTGQYTLVYGPLGPTTTTPGGAKQLTDGDQVITTGAITALFGDSLYVEGLDRSLGVRVIPNQPPQNLQEGSLVTVQGVMRTGDNGERYIETNTVQGQGTASVEPLAITTKALYGGDNLYDPATGAGQRGMVGGIGLNPIGLLVRTLGKVKAINGTSDCQIEDGFGKTVKVLLPSGGPIVSVGQWIGVQGIVSAEKSGSDLLPILRTRRANDVSTNVLADLGGTFTSPNGLLNTSWNLFALPGIPTNPNPATLLANFDPGNGTGIDGRLNRYDAPTQSEVFYLKSDNGKAFGNMLLGEGYRLRTNAGETKTIAFNGLRADIGDFWVSLPKLGATRIGSPLYFPVAWADTQVNDGSRALSMKDAAKTELQPWLKSEADYFDSATQTTKHLGLPEDASDSNLFTPWVGYWVYTMRENLALIVPTSIKRPVLVSLNPGSAVAGGPAFALKVTGSNFTSGVKLYWNGVSRPTTVNSTTEISASIATADIATAGTVNISVSTADFGGVTSNALPFTINNPLPTLTALSPDKVLAGFPAFTLTLTGTNFTPDSVVQWNGAPKPTTFLSSTKLTLGVSVADIAVPGTASLTVFTPGPGGGTSSAKTLLFPGVSVSGKVEMTYCLQPAQTITLTFRTKDGTPNFDKVVTLKPDGTFSLKDLPGKQYDLAIKGKKWLRKVVPLDTTGGDVTGVAATLTPGDANNDNKVNLFDLAALAAAFSSTPGDPVWNEGTDFNCDNSADIFDLAILAEVFNQVGDP